MRIDLQQLADPLRLFFAELGSDAPDPAGHEELALLRIYVEDLPGSATARLRLDTVATLADTYGTALRLSFRLGDLPLLELRAGTALDPAAFSNLQDEARELPALTLDLRLDKRQLLDERFPDLGTDRQTWLFLFPETLTNYLQAATLPDLEYLLGPRENLRRQDGLLLLTPGKDIWLDGPLLTIAGGVHGDRWRDVIGVGNMNAQAANCYRVAHKELRWETRWLHALTPYHLQVDSTGFDDEPEARALRVHLLNALLLFLADRTVVRKERLVSTFSGPTRNVVVGHADASVGESLPADQVRQLFALFEWTYAPEWADGERLSLAQIEIARALATAEPEPDRRLSLLLNNAGRILDELRWGWKELLEDRITNYVAQAEQVESFVSETVSAYAEQVNGMVKSLGDTMLAAVGVVLASFVASVFQSPFNENVLRAGLLAYAGYVLAFPLLYNMGHQWDRHRALDRDFDYRRARYEQRLLPERVQQIIGDEVVLSRRRFQRWFGFTVALYVVIILGALAATFLAPALVSSATP